MWYYSTVLIRGKCRTDRENEMKKIRIISFILICCMALTLCAGCGNKAGYTPVGKMADGLMEVKAGTADVAIVDSVMAEAMVGEGTDYSELGIVDGLVLATEEYGIGFRSGRTAVAKVDEAMQAIMADGTLAAIAEKYGLSLSLAEELVPLGDTGEGDGSDDWAYIKDKGTLVIGITEFAPMNYYDESGKLVGFETEFAEAVCAYLGVTPEFQVINWKTKEVELNAKTIDCIWNGMTIDEDRMANMDFSCPYMVNKQIVVAKADKLDKFDSEDKLAKALIVAEEGSAGESCALEIFG